MKFEWNFVKVAHFRGLFFNQFDDKSIEMVRKCIVSIDYWQFSKNPMKFGWNLFILTNFEAFFKKQFDGKSIEMVRKWIVERPGPINRIAFEVSMSFMLKTYIWKKNLIKWIKKK